VIRRKNHGFQAAVQPPRSFAADAHDCIMAPILADRSGEINELEFGGTLKRPTRSSGFLPRVSHQGRVVQQLSSEEVAPSES
jgi:hypothetical protein